MASDPSKATHSRLSPSAAARWTACPASVEFIERNRSILPPDSTSYADEGERAHELVAEVLIGKHRLLQTDDPDLLTHCRAYIDFVRSHIHPGDVARFERRVPLFYLPNEFGRVDVSIVAPNRITIIDLKYGVGVPVYAENNKQLAIYAESTIEELEIIEEYPDDFPVHLYIYQPRDRNDPEPVRLWHLTRGELRAFCAPITTAANLVQTSGDLPFVPNPDVQCRFCRAKGVCTSYGAYGLSIVTDESLEASLAAPTLVTPDPATLTRTQRIRILDAADSLRDFLNAVEAQEVHELMHGAERAGYKLVEGKSNRHWVSDGDAIALMEDCRPLDEIAPRSVITPAVAFKLLRQEDPQFLKQLNALVVKPPGKPTLVPEDDPRPVMQLTDTEGLENIDLL